MKQKKYPNFQELYSFEDYKKAYDAHSTLDCGLSQICLSAPSQHYSIHTNVIKDKEAAHALINFRTLKLEYAIQVWLKAALISQRNPGPLLYYWSLHYEDNETSFRELKYSKKYSEKSPEFYIEEFWKLLEEIADSGSVKVSEGFSHSCHSDLLPTKPKIEFNVVLDREEVKSTYKDFNDVYGHPYCREMKTYKWDEIKHLFTRLTLKKLSLIDTKQLHKCNMIDKSLMQACSNLDIDEVKLAIKNGANVNALNENGESALQNAVEYFSSNGMSFGMKYSDEEYESIKQINFTKCREIVDYLLDNGADIDLFGVGGMQPITCAYYEHSVEMVRHLLERGSNPNYNSYRDDDVISYDNEDSHRCTILDVICGLLIEEYDDTDKQIESLVREYGGRRLYWDYDPYRNTRLRKYYVSMSASNPNYLFFDNDGWGIGTEQSLTIEDENGDQQTINLPCHEELKQWHEEYKNNIDSEGYDWRAWTKRGHILASFIAQTLHSQIALFFPYGNDVEHKWDGWSESYILTTLREPELIE